MMKSRDLFELEMEAIEVERKLAVPHSRGDESIRTLHKTLKRIRRMSDELLEGIMSDKGHRWCAGKAR